MGGTLSKAVKPFACGSLERSSLRVRSHVPSALPADQVGRSEDRLP